MTHIVFFSPQSYVTRESISEYMNTICRAVPRPSAAQSIIYSTDEEDYTYYNQVCESKSVITTLLDWIESASDVEFKRKILYLLDRCVKTVVTLIFIFAFFVIILNKG